MQARRGWAGLLAGLVFLTLAGCTRTVHSESPYDRAPGVARREAPRQGMSGRQKVLLLAGAAALYYLYNKHKDAPGQGPQGQYYRSRNGRIYYRDARGQAVWVTAPQEPIRVPAEEYERYTGRSPEGYDGRVLREAPAGW